MFAKKNKILYSDWIYEWLIDKKEYIKESTYANYSNNIFNHIIPKLGNIYIQDLNHKTIQDFLLNLFKCFKNLNKQVTFNNLVSKHRCVY